MYAWLLAGELLHSESNRLLMFLKTFSFKKDGVKQAEETTAAVLLCLLKCCLLFVFP